MSDRSLSFDPIAEARRQWSAHGWNAAADGMAAVTSVVRAHQILLGRIDACLRPMSLTFARFELLMLLRFTRNGELPLGKLGDRLQVHPASVTSAVDKLEQQGFVTRLPHPYDGRTTLAQITTAGRRIAGRAAAQLNAEVFAEPGLDSADAQALVEVLTRFRRDAGDFVEG